MEQMNKCSKRVSQFNPSERLLQVGQLFCPLSLANGIAANNDVNISTVKFINQPASHRSR